MIDFADWLRLALLWKHGGVWLDATLLLTAPLDFLVNDTDPWFNGNPIYMEYLPIFNPIKYAPCIWKIYQAVSL